MRFFKERGTAERERLENLYLHFSVVGCDDSTIQERTKTICQVCDF